MKQRLYTAAHYEKLHPELFDASTGWRREWFAPTFFAALADGSETALRSILTEISPGVYAFDMFTPEFCDMLQGEMNVRNVAAGRWERTLIH